MQKWKQKLTANWTMFWQNISSLLVFPSPFHLFPKAATGAPWYIILTSQPEPWSHKKQAVMYQYAVRVTAYTPVVGLKPPAAALKFGVPKSKVSIQLPITPMPQTVWVLYAIK